MKKYEIDLKGEGDYYKVSKSEYEKFPGHKRIVGHEVKGNEPTDWKTDFTYFLEHSITHDEEKINLIVAEVERIAGSKKEETKAKKLLEAAKEIDDYLSEETYQKGKAVHLNNIGAFSILHKNLKTVINEYNKTQP